MSPAKFLCALLLCLSLVPHALAGQSCEARKIGADEFRKGLELASSTAEYLDRSGAKVAVIARVGKNLDSYGLKFSHMGFVYRDASALDGQGAWRVAHKLNHCNTDQSSIYRQGLLEFFLDDLFRYEVGIVILSPESQQALLDGLKDNAFLARMHQPRYNMVAYPWSTKYQQSNQWLLETLAMAMDTEATSRENAQRWLQQKNYRPSTLTISLMSRLGARVGMANVAFDDHPMDRRTAGKIDTVTADSVFNWLTRSQLGEKLRVIRAGERQPPAPPAKPLGKMLNTQSETPMRIKMA